MIRPKRKSRTPKDGNITPLKEYSNRGEPIEILDEDEDEDQGKRKSKNEDSDEDEETFAVEKVLNHRIGVKENVSHSSFILR